MSVLPARSDAQPRVESDPALGHRLPTEFAVVGIDMLRGLIPDWDRVSGSSPLNSFVQSPWFAQILWAHERAARQELLVVTGRDAEGELCALLPMVRERSRMPFLGLDTLRPLGMFGVEQSAPVLSAESHPDATARLVDFVLGERGPACDVVEFGTVAVGSELHHALRSGAADHDQPFVMGAALAHPQVHPAAQDGVIEIPGPSSRFRRNLRRAWRRVGESGRRVECREISWEWQRWQDDVARIYQARWGDGGPNSTHALHHPRRLALVDTLLCRLDRHFRAAAFGCFVDEQLAAYLIALRGGNEALIWATGMDPEFGDLSVGKLLLDTVLHALASHAGVTRIALGKGDEPFKLAWADTSYPVASMSVVRATGLKRRRALLRHSPRPGASLAD